MKLLIVDDEPDLLDQEIFEIIKGDREHLQRVIINLVNSTITFYFE